jgi:hypothetical protein
MVGYDSSPKRLRPNGLLWETPLTRQIKEKQLVGGFSPSPLKIDGLRQLGG